jgi:diguanylate cyclase (GGDEF)-like protein
LTGLPNRALFLDRLNQALSAGHRHNRRVAVMFLDLDRFNEINDTQGHAVGDLVLVEVAHRFRAVLRQEESLARVGGDEFIVLAQVSDQSDAVQIVERLRMALSVPVEVKGLHYPLRVSIGIAMYPDDGQTADELFKHADVAMYRAKAYGSGYRFYEPGMSAGMADRMALARDLQQALHGAAGQLSLHYQPQVKLATGKLVGVEALLRWNHPIQGLISPGVFIPIAEERGMMRELGEWVFREACRQLARWRAAGMPLPGRLAINVAAQQMDDKDFAALALAMVAEAGLKAEMFELELTESGLMRNVGQALGLMGALKMMGFALAIDDFGTGYSSLAYLKQLPADKIKIDMSFVRDMLENRNDHAIVATIIGMGRNLHLKTIAEGVETPAQVEVLLALGCDEAQGYFFGQPMPADEFAPAWLEPVPDGGKQV